MFSWRKSSNYFEKQDFWQWVKCKDWYLSRMGEWHPSKIIFHQKNEKVCCFFAAKNRTTDDAFFFLQDVPVKNSSLTNGNLVVSSSPPSWWKSAKMSCSTKKIFLELYSKTVLRQSHKQALDWGWTARKKEQPTQNGTAQLVQLVNPVSSKHEDSERFKKTRFNLATELKESPQTLNWEVFLAAVSICIFFRCGPTNFKKVLWLLYLLFEPLKKFTSNCFRISAQAVIVDHLLVKHEDINIIAFGGCNDKWAA